MTGRVGMRARELVFIVAVQSAWDDQHALRPRGVIAPGPRWNGSSCREGGKGGIFDGLGPAYLILGIL